MCVDHRRRYSDETHRKAVEIIRGGAGRNTLMRRLDIFVGAARNWIRLSPTR